MYFLGYELKELPLLGPVSQRLIKKEKIKHKAYTMKYFPTHILKTVAKLFGKRVTPN